MSDKFTGLGVVGLLGSLRPGSYTRIALDIALQGATEMGAKTQLLDLSEYELAFCTGPDQGNYPADVYRLRDSVRKAQGIILATPEYHGSYSGVLKKALDLMGFDEFAMKMVGLVGVSGGAMGASGALASLRTVGRSLRAWVLPLQVSIAQGRNAFDKNGHLKDNQIHDRLLEIGRQVARFAYLHTSEQAHDFLLAWEESQPNPGGRCC